MDLPLDFAELYRDVLPAPTASPLNVIFCGYGEKVSSGAWKMRAEQIASRRTNWQAITIPTEEQLATADLVCFVKKPNNELIKLARALGRTVIYDVIDSWKQPHNNRAASNMAEARQFFRNHWKHFDKFDGHIFATRRMYEDLSALSRYPTYIYHHSNPLLKVSPLREIAKTVGYQGDERFLGRWRPIIEELCAARGLDFTVNPADYGIIDIGFAVRDDDFAGYFPNKYKSNVKMANFMATGTPCIVGTSEVAYHEVGMGGIGIFDDTKLNGAQLAARLEALLPLTARQAARADLLAAAPHFYLPAIADQFERYFTAVHARVQDDRNYPKNSPAAA